MKLILNFVSSLFGPVVRLINNIYEARKFGKINKRKEKIHVDTKAGRGTDARNGFNAWLRRVRRKTKD